MRRFLKSSVPATGMKIKYMYPYIGASQLVLGVKNLPANTGAARDTVSTPGSGRSPAERNGNPLQYFCLENSMDRGGWWATESDRVAVRLD